MRIDGGRFLVTGGAGFIGSALIEQLVAAGAEAVLALDNMVRGRRANLARALASNRVELIEGDIRDADLVRRAVDRVDGIFHLAALRINHCAAEPDQAFQVMYEAPFHLLRYATERRIGRVVAASSSSIYGMADAFPTDERHHPYNDTTLYGAGKLALEGMLRSFRDMYGLEFAALRPFNVYGPRMDIHGAYTEVMVRWMERIEAGEPPLVFGDGTQSMDFTYVDDVATAFRLAMQVEQAASHVFNVGTGIETSLAGLAAAMMRAMGRELTIAYRPPRSVSPVARRRADMAKAADILDFRPAVPLDEGLRRLVDWWRGETGRTAG